VKFTELYIDVQQAEAAIASSRVRAVLVIPIDVG